mmetsp:Transcript_102569/g.328642  ORF Transcript_102569/g.328642 Transcript_102569/m.328642 type:complete len:208 (-) Transcript_102569:636-1259(-)
MSASIGFGLRAFPKSTSVPPRAWVAAWPLLPWRGKGWRSRTRKSIRTPRTRSIPRWLARISLPPSSSRRSGIEAPWASRTLAASMRAPRQRCRRPLGRRGRPGGPPQAGSRRQTIQAVRGPGPISWRRPLRGSTRMGMGFWTARSAGASLHSCVLRATRMRGARNFWSCAGKSELQRQPVSHWTDSAASWIAARRACPSAATARMMT